MKTSPLCFSRVLALMAALSLALALAGCGGRTSSSQSSSSSGLSSSSSASSSSAMPSSGAASSSSPLSSSTSMPMADDGLEEILDGMMGFGPGTAGSSLSSMGRAADLLNWSSAYAPLDSQTLSRRLDGWFSALDAESQANLKETWPMVKEAAHSLLSDPEGNAPLLEDAGATLQPAQPSKENFETLASLLDAAILC